MSNETVPENFGFEPQRQYYNSKYQQVLPQMNFTELRKVDKTEPIGVSGEQAVNGEFSLSHPLFDSIYNQMEQHLNAVCDNTVSSDVVLQHLQSEFQKAFELLITTTNTSVSDGFYEKDRYGNWKSVARSSVYKDYRKLLQNLTENAETMPTVNRLYDPFLSELVASDTHRIPTQDAISQLILEHIRQMNMEISEAQRTLEIELKNQGVAEEKAETVAKNVFETQSFCE